ncbi:hypothetical protein F4604DRAFT_1922975 [Suillus subluteus]|nr:hypothetical protein F4604DRAFT_1922975 [Suillus subluteus]
MSIAEKSSTLTTIHHSTLCAHRWLKQIKTNGTTEEFGAYYMSLAENQRTAYNNEAADLVATDKWDKAIGQGKMN